jgi:hypothetical protein
MQVELLVIPECPGAHEASRLLRVALDDVGLSDTGFTVTVIGSDAEARSRGFAGSPAILVDGVDLFEAGDGQGSLACRVYPTPEGPRNVPALPDLRQALKARAARE